MNKRKKELLEDKAGGSITRLNTRPFPRAFGRSVGRRPLAGARVQIHAGEKVRHLESPIDLAVFERQIERLGGRCSLHRLGQARHDDFLAGNVVART